MVIGLVGELGAGKTSFVRGIAKGLGVAEDMYVSSPTFVITKVYPGALTLYHVDLYRINSPEDVEYLAVSDYVDDGVVVIEWADKFQELLPSGAEMIYFRVVSEDVREIEIPDTLLRRGSI